jgi:hypothetical protein
MKPKQIELNENITVQVNSDKVCYIKLEGYTVYIEHNHVDGLIVSAWDDDDNRDIYHPNLVAYSNIEN